MFWLGLVLGVCFVFWLVVLGFSCLSFSTLLVYFFWLDLCGFGFGFLEVCFGK